MTTPTDQHLADQLRKLAESPRSLTPDDRTRFLLDVAERLERDTQLEPIALAGKFTFRPLAPVGDLLHPEADGPDLHGVLIAGITLSDAEQVATSLTTIWEDA